MTAQFGKRSASAGPAWCLAAAALLVAAFATGPVRAEVSPSCVDFRRTIGEMEASAVRPPQWLTLDFYLRRLYQRDCIDHPGYVRPPQFWYRIDGSATGVALGAAERPRDGAYATTQEHAKLCAGSGSPSVCALMLDAEAGKDREAYDAADALPPLTLTLGGEGFAAGADCVHALEELAVIADGKNRGLRNRMVADNQIATLRDSCPDLLAALARQAGVAVPEDGAENAAFWHAAGAVIRGGFDVAVPGVGAAGGAASAVRDPGFARMCQQADTMRNQCRARQQRMGEVGTVGNGTRGQAGAFDDCANLYGQVVTMCRATASPPATKAIAKAAPSAAKNPAGTAPPQAAGNFAGASPACQQLAQSYVAAAQAKDEAGTLSGYQALKQDCKAMLDEVTRQTGMALPEASPFPQRTMGGLTQSLMGGCMNAGDSCADEADNLAAGTSGAARAALFNEAAGFGLALGNLMIQGMAAGQAMHAPSLPSRPTTNATTLNRQVQHTYGQGAPTGPPPPSYQSTITGTP
jgi:hypothetical protein